MTKSALSVHCGGVYGEDEDKGVLVNKVSKRERVAEEYQKRKWDSFMANLNFSKFFQEGVIKY